MVTVSTAHHYGKMSFSEGFTVIARKPSTSCNSKELNLAVIVFSPGSRGVISKSADPISPGFIGLQQKNFNVIAVEDEN